MTSVYKQTMRIAGILIDAHCVDREIKLPAELSDWIVNEICQLAADVQQLENSIVPQTTRDLPPPTGANVVSLAERRATSQKKQSY